MYICTYVQHISNSNKLTENLDQRNMGGVRVCQYMLEGSHTNVAGIFVVVDALALPVVVFFFFVGV